MPALDTISVKGFKSIASIENLKIGAINVIIGANGSGKSNFLGLFSLLNAIFRGHLQAYVGKAGGADSVLHFGSKITQRLEVHVSFRDGMSDATRLKYDQGLVSADCIDMNDGISEYAIVLEPRMGDRLYPISETVSFRDRMRSSQSFSNTIIPHGMEADISSFIYKRINPIRNTLTGGDSLIRGHLESFRDYHFHDTGESSPMKKTARLDDNHYLRSDGSNLAAFLYLLRERQETSYSLIRRTVQLMAPFFDDFILEPQELNPDTILLKWRHKGSDACFYADSLSDGTLRFIALATVFLQPDVYQHQTTLLDEPELGLHPYAITLLASLVKRVAVKTQVILSTQSPRFLDHFEPEDVLVADRVDGGTQFTRLESAKLESWLEEYSLGQLWEKNEFGGRPTSE